MAKLTISELKYLSSAVLFNWEAQQWTNRTGNKAWYWQGDKSFPVKVGKTMDKLVSMGLMERLVIGIPRIRATEKAFSLQCKKCHRGRLFNDSDEDIGACPSCKGVGLTPIPQEALWIT